MGQQLGIDHVNAIWDETLLVIMEKQSPGRRMGRELQCKGRDEWMVSLTSFTSLCPRIGNVNVINLQLPQFAGKELAAEVLRQHTFSTRGEKSESIF